MEKAKIGIIGATGYVGVELVRALSAHEGTQITCLVSRSYAGRLFSDVYPAFSGICDIELTSCTPVEIAKKCDLVITALPHGVSSQIVPELLDGGIKVIDHSGDFRYRDVKIYESVYKLTHPRPDLAQSAVYGMPEIYRDVLKTASLAADPGCYPTCSILALMPLLKKGLIDTNNIIINAVSGLSGAGRKADLTFSFCENDASYKPYGATFHRHTSEMEQECSAITGEDVTITFTPHLAPFKRGMLATICADPSLSEEKIDNDSLYDLYKETYKNEPFVRIFPADKLPEIRHVVGTNFIDISVVYDARTHKIKIFSTLDNLGKGAATQAIQTMNIMLGFPETQGLSTLIPSI